MSTFSAAGAPVCIVTPEFHGLPGSGGIGTAFAGLAGALARAGHPVTVLLVGQRGTVAAFDAAAASARAKGIELVVLPEAPLPQGGSHWSGISYQVFRWLAERSFRVVHFADWLGLGYWATAAKRQGLAFQVTTLTVGLHGPTRWTRDVANTGLQGIDELEVDLLERGSAEQADAIVSPSAYMLNWVSGAGWRLPAETVVVPNILPLAEVAKPTGSTVRETVREIVFFGRLEGRKGVVLFCDALDRMAPHAPDGLRVTFLGASAPVNGEDGAALVRRRAAAWQVPTSFIDNHSSAEALAYLTGAGRLAVIPSLGENLPCTVFECLSLGLPFLASAVGGIPELIEEADHARVLFEPDADALAARLQDVLDGGVLPARVRTAPEETVARWTAWHANRVSRPAGAVRSVNIARTSEAPGDYVLVPAPGVAVAEVALEQCATAAAHTGAAVIAGALESPEGLWLAPVASVGVAPFRTVVGPGPLLVRRDRLSGFPAAGDQALAWQKCLVQALFAGERIETVPVAVGYAGTAPAAQDTLSAAERLAAFRSAAPTVLGDLAGLASSLAGQVCDVQAQCAHLQAEKSEVLRERNGFAAELERAAVEAAREDAFWRARLSGLMASRSWGVTAGLRARFGGIENRALAALPPDRAVELVRGSVWWDLAAPIRAVVRVLRRLRDQAGGSRRGAGAPQHR